VRFITLVNQQCRQFPNDATLQDMCQNEQALTERLPALLKIGNFINVFPALQAMVVNCIAAGSKCALGQQDTLLPDMFILDMDADELDTMLTSFAAALGGSNKQVQGQLHHYVSAVHHEISAMKSWMEQSMQTQSAQTSASVAQAQLKIVQANFDAAGQAPADDAISIWQLNVNQLWFDALAALTHAKKQATFMTLTPAECSNPASLACHDRRYTTAVYTSPPTISNSAQEQALQAAIGVVEQQLLEPSVTKTREMSAELTHETHCTALAQLRSTGSATFNIPLPANTKFSKLRFKVSSARGRCDATQTKLPALTLAPPL